MNNTPINNIPTSNIPINEIPMNNSSINNAPINNSEAFLSSKGMKAISLLLMLGGVLGVGIAIVIDARYLMSPGAKFFSPSVAIAGVFILLFGWAVWTGIDLWRGRSHALTWARILFAIQIPTIIVPGFSYEFHVGFIARLMVSSAVRINFGFNLGSSFNFYVASSIQQFAVGINVFAVAVLIYLMHAERPAAVKSDNLGLI